MPFAFRRLMSVVSVFTCLVVHAQDDASPGVNQLKEAEAQVVEYFKQTPTGKCKWQSRVLKANNELLWQINYDVAYTESQVFWSESPLPIESLPKGIAQVYLYTNDRQIHWLKAPEQPPLLMSRPLSCFDQDPMLGIVVHPRYLGTGLDGLIGGLVEKSSRGIFADGGLERIRAERDVLNGQTVLKGIYKLDGWDVEIYYSTSEPTLVMKTVKSVMSNSAIHKSTVNFEYKRWDCGVFYPARVRSDYSYAGEITNGEEVITTDFRTLDAGEVEKQFSLAALEFPNGELATVIDDSCDNYDSFLVVDGDLVGMTQQESAVARAKFASDSNVKAASTVDSVTALDSIPQSNFWVYVVAVFLTIACGLLYGRLKRSHR